jgi:hypothetical protein
VCDCNSRGPIGPSRGDVSMTVNIPDLTNEWDQDKLRNWMANARRLERDDIYHHARRLERDDIYHAAFRQLCRIEGRDLDDPLLGTSSKILRVSRCGSIAKRRLRFLAGNKPMHFGRKSLSRERVRPDIRRWHRVLISCR